MTRALLILAVAFVTGSALAYLPHLATEPCQFEPDIPEGSSGGVESRAWPLRERCVYDLPDGTRRTVAVDGPEVPTTLAVIAGVALLAWPRRALTRGVTEGLAFAASGILGAFTGTFLIPPLLALVAIALVERRHPRTIVALPAALVTWAAVTFSWFVI